MRKAVIEIEEKLSYRRRIDVLVPDHMTEDELEAALDRAELQDSISDFIYVLRDYGIECPKGYDDDLSSPDHSEVECDYYEFLDEDGDSQ